MPDSQNFLTNIPWSVTPNSVKSRQMLNTMFLSLEEGSHLKTYLTEYCAHLLEPLVKDTGIPVDYFDFCAPKGGKKFMNSKPTPTPLLEGFSAKFTEGYANKAGMYSLFCPETNEHYVGANMDFELRLKQHYHDYRGNVNRLLYLRARDLGINHFVWQPVVQTPHYYLDFARTHLDLSNDYQTYRILTDFIKYETRLLVFLYTKKREQAVKSHINPKLNGVGDVTLNGILMMYAVHCLHDLL